MVVILSNSGKFRRLKTSFCRRSSVLWKFFIGKRPKRCFENRIGFRKGKKLLSEKLQAPTDRYLRKLVKIPTPEFYVFYNGKEDYPETTTLRLSDAFIIKSAPAPLELTVQVLNINTDKANKILAACRPLEEYSLFVEEVRKQTQLDGENGFTKTVKICIEKGVLKDYLQRKSREVINMLLAEYDYDTDIAVQRAEERRIALAEGIEQGFSDGSHQAKLETARILKRLGDSVQKIMQATGLTGEELENL